MGRSTRRIKPERARGAWVRTAWQKSRREVSVRRTNWCACRRCDIRCAPIDGARAVELLAATGSLHIGVGRERTGGGSPLILLAAKTRARESGGNNSDRPARPARPAGAGGTALRWRDLLFCEIRDLHDRWQLRVTMAPG